MGQREPREPGGKGRCSNPPPTTPDLLPCPHREANGPAATVSIPGRVNMGRHGSAHYRVKGEMALANPSITRARRLLRKSFINVAVFINRFSTAA